MAYINVDEVYILDNTGLQVDMATDIPFVDAGFTDTQKAQARKNIGAGATNPNLLDNPWFTVNQRGQASYTSGTTVDRWKFSAQPSTVTVTTNGITLARGGISGTPMQFVQQVEADVWNSLIGRKATASVMLDDGSVYSTTATIAADMTSTAATIGNTGFAIDIRGISSSGYRWIRIQSPYNAAASSINIRAVKFEVGEMSTLANDAPPDYGTELAKCQRYFLRLESGYRIFGVGEALATTQIRIFVPTPVSMYKKSGATATMSGGIVLRSIHNSSLTPTAMSLDAILINGVDLTFTVSGATQYAVYLGVQSGSNNPIDISCDL